MAGNTAIAIYKPHPGKEEALMELVRKHFPALREYGLVTKKDGYVLRSKDGSILEIFEWAAPNSAQLAHEHPAIGAIWEAMDSVASFPGMADLPEANGQFPNFESIDL